MKRLLMLGAVLVFGLAPAAAAPIPDVELRIAEYQGDVLACGGSYTIRTWIIGVVSVRGAPATVAVNAWTGDAGEHLAKFDRFRALDVPPDSKAVRLDWFTEPDDRGEPYDWRFELIADGAVISDCTVTVTRT